MQGQRGTFGSLPETFSFDHGATSSSAVDPQIFWSNMQNPVDNRPPENMSTPAGTTMTYVNPASHEQHMSNAWNLCESSSHGPMDKVSQDEQRTQLRWSPLTLCAEAGRLLEEQQCEPSSRIPLDGTSINPLCTQSSNSHMMSRNFNLNAGSVINDSNHFQVIGRPNLYKPGAPENEQILPPGGSSSLLLPPGSRGYLPEENYSRAGSSSEGRRRASCKRKAVEGNVENCCLSGSCSYLHRGESSGSPTMSASYDGGSSLSISAPSGQVNSGLGLGASGVPNHLPDRTVAENAERSRRNYRVHINSSNQQKSIPHAHFPTGTAVRHSSISSAQHSSGLLPNGQSLDSRTGLVEDSTPPPSQPVLLHVPMFPQNLQPLPWDKGSSSRSVSSSSSNGARDRNVQHGEARARIMGRSLLENPLFVPTPDLRSFVQNPSSRNLAGGNISIPGNVASTSQAGSSSGVQPPAAPTWVPNPNPSHYPHGFSELIRRSLISSSGFESAGQSSNQTPLHSGSLTPEGLVLLSRAGNHRHHQSYRRSASRLERQDSIFGYPHPVRALANVGEGRNRLVVSEHIRNVLDLMRRGEGVRFEDVMVLDQSIFFGVADIHDRHRDMRLDVDNMSYEELLALEERIGNVNTGLSEETIQSRMKQNKYSIPVGSHQEQEPCSVCQEEYKDGEEIGILDCGHVFHTCCIKQWLMQKNLCPICKTMALHTS